MSRGTTTVGRELLELLHSRRGGELGVFGVSVGPKEEPRHIRYHGRTVALLFSGPDRLRLRPPPIQEFMQIHLVSRRVSEGLQYAFNTVEERGETSPVYELTLTGDIPHKLARAAPIMFKMMIDGKLAALFQITKNLLSTNPQPVGGKTYRVRTDNGRVRVTYTRVGEDRIVLDEVRLRYPIRHQDPAGHYALGGDNDWPRNALAPIIQVWSLLLSARVLDTGVRVQVEEEKLYLHVDRQLSPRNRQRIGVDGTHTEDIAVRATRDPRRRELETLMREAPVSQRLDRLEALERHLERLRPLEQAATRLRKELRGVLAQRGITITVEELLARERGFLNTKVE